MKNTTNLTAKLLLIIGFLFISCKQKPAQIIEIYKEPSIVIEKQFKYDTTYLSTKFQIPVGNPPGKEYYNAQKFTENNHLGEDWNAVTGGNSDLGDPIYASGSGFVKKAQDYGSGWGKVIQILHRLPDSSQVVSLYAHCDSLLVTKGEYVTIGDQIATIGNANGAYLAHLHFEIRTDTLLPIGGGYSAETTGYVDPSEFINQN